MRSVANRYLVAVAKGDGKTGCALLSRKGLDNGEYASRAACIKDLDSSPLRVIFKIARVRFRSSIDAAVEVADAASSDSGNDTITEHRYGTRWLIDAG